MAGSIFRRRLETTEDTDVPSTVNGLRDAAAQAGIPAFSVDALEAQFRKSIGPLVRRGKELRALGSRLEVERKIEGPGYSVTIVFRVGEQPSLAKRIARRLGIQ